MGRGPVDAGHGPRDRRSGQAHLHSGEAPAWLTEAATSWRAPDEAPSSVLGLEPDPQQTSLGGDGGPNACREAVLPVDPSEGFSGTRMSNVWHSVGSVYER